MLVIKNATFFINCQCIFHFLMIKNLRSLYIVDKENHVTKLSMLWMVLFACWVYCQGQKKQCNVKVVDTNVRFVSYSKCSNWRRISKLLSNFCSLFTFGYLDGANSIKTKLQTCDLWLTNWPVHKLQICESVLIEFAPSK